VKNVTAAEKRTEIFENLPVHKAVAMQIIPAIASQMIALIYNLADTYFVGQLNDPNQTAGVTVGLFSFALLTAISNLFGIGGASLMARSLGQKNPEKARQISTVSFYGGLLSAIVFSLTFFTFASPILRISGATDSTYSYAFNYTKWVIMLGGPLAIMNTLLANLVRAEGGATHASIGVSMGGVINIILDPFFVLPRFLDLGAAGAGMATAISNLLATLYFVVYLIRNRNSTLITLRISNLKFIKTHLKPILTIGFPSAVQYALTVVAVAAHAKFVSNYTTEAVAGLGIIKKLDQLPLYFSIGLSNGLLPLLAYNHGQGNHDRRSACFKFGVSISLGFSMLCLVCYEAFAPFLVGLFIDDAATRAYGAVFLRIMVTAMPLMSVVYPMIIQFQAMGSVRESLICSIIRKGVVDIPLLYVLDSLLPLYGTMLVQPIVDAISLIVAIYFYRKIRRKQLLEN